MYAAVVYAVYCVLFQPCLSFSPLPFMSHTAGAVT